MKTLIQIALACLLAIHAPESRADFKQQLAAEAAAAEAAITGPKDRLSRELEPREAGLWKQLETLAGPSDAVKVADGQRRAAMTALMKMDPAKLRTRAELDEFDGLTRQRDAGELAVKRLTAERRAAVRKRATESAEGKRLLAELVDVEGKIAAAQKELAEVTARATAAKTRLKTYTAAPPPTDPKTAKNPMLELKPPADAAERAKRFAARNSPGSIAALAKEFFARIDLTKPGLEKIPALLAAEQHGAALESWRDHFFAKLREPLKHGLPAQWGEDIDTASWLRFPQQAKLDEAMRGIFSTPKAKAHVGAPGTINWADPGPEGDADPERNPRLDFYTTRGQGGFVDFLGPHLVLLEGYAATGERRYLDRWTEVLDDWAMNAPGDMERAPFNIRQYPVLCSFRPVAFASTLSDVLIAQPDFARALPAATLARVMLTAMEEYPAAYVRLARRGIYNWVDIAATGSVLTAQVFPEFRAAQWQLAETKRLIELNWTHKILRDGGNLEQANWGHEPNDQVHLGRAFRLLQNQPPTWLDDAWRAEWFDNVKVNARYYLHVLKPDGFTYRFARVTTSDKFVMNGRLDDPAMPIQSNLLLGEPESRRRLEWLYAKDATEPPQIASESLAYFGAAILRGGWERDASFLYFQSSPNRDTGGREDANGFTLHAYGHELLLAPPLAVDDRTQNIHHGLVDHPGGKTLWLTYDDRGIPVESRFHASHAFDFAEGEYRGVYQLHPSKTEGDIFGDYGYAKLGDALRKKGDKDEPIRDVRHTRQVLCVRGEDVTIVTDRIRSDMDRKFAQNYTLFTPVAREGWKRRIELAAEEQRPPLVVDAAAHSLRTDNHELPGVSLRHFGTVQPTYTVTENAFTKTGAAVTSDEALAALGSAKLKKWMMGLPLPFSEKVRAEWTSRGEQVLVTLIATRPGVVGAPAFTGDPREGEAIHQQGVTGFRATLRNGKQLQYVASVKPAGKLQCGHFAVEGEALLVVSDGATANGIALGCTRLTQSGKAHAATGDFEFTATEKNFVSTPIYRPIQPVVIAPEATVFTDSQRVELSCATPGVEIRYTLDGTDPTPQSPRYHAPFTLTSTTRVKARAFRPGLAETPWTADDTHATVMSWTTFEKQPALPAVTTGNAKPGLAWEYMEGRWPQLFTNALHLPALKTGVAPALLDVSMRGTDGALAIRASGLLNVPADGIYTFHAPHEWMFPDGESGYDLRVFIHDREWQPATRRHAHGTWSIALQKGAHPLRVVFTDFRPRTLKGELWDGFPNPGIVWKGTVPTLQVSGPGMSKRALPAEWLVHSNAR